MSDSSSDIKRGLHFRDWLRGSGGALTVGYFAGCLVYVVFICGIPWGPGILSTISDIVVIPLSGGAAVGAWLTSRTPSLLPRRRSAWQLVAVAYGCYAIGDVIWFVANSIMHVEPFPSPADAVYLLYYPAMMLALLRFSDELRDRDETVRFALDACTVLVAGLMFVGHLLVRPIVFADDRVPFKLAMSVLYPAVDLVLLFGMISLWLRRSSFGVSLVPTFLLLTTCLLFGADVVFVYQNATNGYASGGIADVVYVASYAMCVVGARYAHLRAGHDPDRDPAPTVRRVSLLPYAAVVMAYIIVLIAPDDERRVLIGIAGILTVLVVVRQIVAARRLEQAQRELRSKNDLLERALSEVKQLQGLLPICSYCKSVRDDDNYWQKIENYITDHTDAVLSHGICPGCYEKIVRPQLDRFKDARADD